MRGIVQDMAEVQESHADFIIFGEGSTIFVRVRRILVHIINPADFERQYSADISRIRRVPGTPVVSREIWVLSPWGCWQYFRVLDDGIIEVRRNGDPVVPGGKKKPAPARPAQTGPETGCAPAPVMAGSNCMPEKTKNESVPSLPGTGISPPLPEQGLPVVNGLSTAGGSPPPPVIGGNTSSGTVVTRV